MASELELKEAEKLIDRIDDDIAFLQQQLAELERERDELVKTYGLQDIMNEDCGIPLDDEELYARA